MSMVIYWLFKVLLLFFIDILNLKALTLIKEYHVTAYISSGKYTLL
ncbi:hypothetical protein [Listeria sp. PSOL-1]|nr:hypothetical protein [Listeria sp. PSOL-1]